MQNEQRIKQEMFETRAALAKKLVTLEQKVVGTVDQVTNAVSDTVQAIKGTVDDAKETASVVNETVQESVKSVQKSLDVDAHVQAHPWLAVAGSVATGFCLGAMLINRSRPSLPACINPARPLNGVQAAPPVRTEPGLFTAEINKLKGLALGALFGTAREMLASSFPEPVNQQMKDIIDSATRKVGGEPIPSSTFASLMQPKPSPEKQDKEWTKRVPVETGGEA